MKAAIVRNPDREQKAKPRTISVEPNKKKGSRKSRTRTRSRASQTRNRSQTKSKRKTKVEEAKPRSKANPSVAIEIIVKPMGDVVIEEFRFDPNMLEGVSGSDRIFMLEDKTNASSVGSELDEEQLNKLRQIMTVKTAAQFADNLPLMEEATESSLGKIWFPVNGVINTPQGPFSIEKRGRTTAISDKSFLIEIYFVPNEKKRSPKSRRMCNDCVECCKEKWDDIGG